MKIIKCDYSVHPWRLVDDNGCEVYTLEPVNHPGCGKGKALGWTVVHAPVADATRNECEEKNLQLLARLMLSRRRDSSLPSPTLNPTEPEGE